MTDEHPLAERIARAVRRGIPSRIGTNLIEQATPLQLRHERVVRAVGKGNIGNRDGIAARHIVRHDVGKIRRTLTQRTVIDGHIRLVGAPVGVRIHREDDIRLLRRAHIHPTGGENRIVDRGADLLIRVRRHSVRAASPVVPNEDKRHLMTLFVHGARQHEEGDLVDARHGLKARLSELCAYRCEMPTLKMGLGERRIIITAEREVVERPILAHEIDEELVDRIVLLAASHPVREGFLRDEAREELILLALAAR